MCFQKKLALEGRIEQIRRIKCSCIEFLAFGSLGVRLDAGLSNFLAFALIRCEVGRAFFRQGSLWTLSSFSKCLLIIFVSFQQISGNINENKDHNPSGPSRCHIQYWPAPASQDRCGLSGDRSTQLDSAAGSSGQGCRGPAALGPGYTRVGLGGTY